MSRMERLPVSSSRSQTMRRRRTLSGAAKVSPRWMHSSTSYSLSITAISWLLVIIAVVAILLGMAVLGEALLPRHFAGMALIGLSVVGDVWWWVTIVVLVREIGITVYRFVVVSDHVLAAAWMGKLKTMAQAVALSLALAQQVPELVELALELCDALVLVLLGDLSLPEAAAQLALLLDGGVDLLVDRFVGGHGESSLRGGPQRWILSIQSAGTRSAGPGTDWDSGWARGGASSGPSKACSVRKSKNHSSPGS
mgnify:CR=1 FL=1